MGSGPAKAGGLDHGLLRAHNGTFSGETEPSKAAAKRQALEKITGLLANQDALDALCRDLFESMSIDDGGRSISRCRLRMLTRLVINSCQVSDPSSLQELLDVLVPLHSRIEGEEDAPQMGYDGFLPHARCVLRVIDAVLQVELDGDGSELKGMAARVRGRVEDDIAMLTHSCNGESCDVPLTSSRRIAADDRAVIITAEDLREARGSVSVAAAVVEAAMPDSVVPGPLEIECEAAIQDVVGVETNVSVTAGRCSPVLSVEAPMRATSPSLASRSQIVAPAPATPWSLAAASGMATPPLSIRAPQLVSLGSSLSSTFASSVAVASSCAGFGGSLPSKPLRPSLSCASLGYGVDMNATVAASMLSQDVGSRSRVHTPRSSLTPRSATPTVPASLNGMGSLPSSRSTTPRPVVRRSVGLPNSVRAPRQCSPQGRPECVPVTMPSVSSSLTALLDLHGVNGIARSQSPTRHSAGCIRTPAGPLCITPVTAQVPQLSGGSAAHASLPLNPVLAPGCSARSSSPLRPPSHLRACDVYAMSASYASRANM
mmetsp:Transcript_28709/g.46229  ORF Transcript_28709/g.46229 Transcript_28709/m.46229 type:complete len:544 (-) Transcript_28709:50-1681(-)